MTREHIRTRDTAGPELWLNTEKIYRASHESGNDRIPLCPKIDIYERSRWQLRINTRPVVLQWCRLLG